MGRRLKATPAANVTRPKPKEVVVRNVAHPATWTQALKLAGGDKSRLKVVSMGRIEILPPARHKQA